jgi:uncharacterized protein YjbI with pentapeptide repeats
MKVIKPAKLPVLTRVIERARVPELHVAAMLGFPLAAPRALLDEMAFWAAVSTALGANGVVDEGLAKTRGELLVAGSFHAPGGVPVPASFVRVQLGAVDKRLAVLGDRIWKDDVPTEPEPIAVMPVDWPHALGGAGFDRNPYGKGAAPVEVDGQPVQPLPNIEHDGALLRSPTERPEPAGFSAMDLTFAQRRARAGTYDDRWLEEHFPGLPPDAAPTFFNVAPEDQWIDGFFGGDETFVVENMHPDTARLEGRLPGLVTRAFATRKARDGERFDEIPMRWDTVWLFPSAGIGVVIAHGKIPVAEDDAADVVHLACACEDPTALRTIDHYQAVLARRLDKDKGAIAGLSDSDLMPPRASGVAPNLAEQDIGRWVKSENLHAHNMKRGEARLRADRRALIEAEGLDPKDYGLDEPPPDPPAPPDDPDALAAYIEEQTANADAQMADLDAKAAAAKEQARAVAEEMGEDFDAMMAQGEQKGMGPPKPPPLDEADLEDLDAALREQLLRQHAGLVDMYRRFGHLQPTAAAMAPEDAERTRVLVGLARDTGEGLAERDLTGADLSGINLAGVDLSRAFLEAANLSGCDLSGANLEGAVLAKADLRGAKLAGARMRGANLGGARLGGAVLDDVDLTEGILSRAELDGARITRSKLTGVDWLETRVGAVDLTGSVLGDCNILNADLSGAQLAGVDLTGANLVDCTLDGADLSNAVLHKTTFVRCTGRGVSFRGAQLRQGVMVHGSSFPEADFSDADLERANLRGTDLTGARFDRANLAEADISECDLTGGRLERVVLRGGALVRTNLTRATLRGANLMDATVFKARVPGTDFGGANLHRADLSRVVGDEATSFAGAEVGHVRTLPKATPPRGDA